MKEAEISYREAYNFFKANLLPNHPFIGSSMSNLALIYSKLNRLKESYYLLREALNFRKANLLPNHPLIGDSMNYLADILIKLNRL